MATRFAFALVAPLGVAMAGCASQHGGYSADAGASLGGPRAVRMATAEPRDQPPRQIRSATDTVQPRYVYRGGRDPVTGRAYVQEGPPLTR